MTVDTPTTPVAPRPVPELDPVDAPAPDAARSLRTVPADPDVPPTVRPDHVAPPTVRRRGPTRLPTGTTPDRTRPVILLVVILGVSVLLGRIAGSEGPALVHERMLPWILGRSLGVATFVALSGTVLLGLWLRHPWRGRFRRPGAESILWGHVSLAACTVALLIGHVTSLALDRYAGVGWTGAFVPWGAHFRPTGTALGTLGLYLLALVVGTAALAGSIGRAVWFPIHTASVVVFCVCLAHGVLTGSDSVALRWLYAASGVTVLVLQFTRWLAGTLRHGPAVVDA